MPVVIGNGSTAKIVLYAVLASDHITKATGKTIAIKISKDGAAFGDPSGGATNATEIGSGWYYFTPSATDTGTNGPLIVLGTEASIDDTTRDLLVEAASSVPTTSQIATAVWQTTVPGSFTTGQAGNVLGNLHATVWDEINTGVTHNLANSTGRQLRTLAINTGVIYGPATAPSQAGMTSTQMTLDAGASSSNQAYQWSVLNIISGTGAGQSAVITNYVGASRLATIDSPWVIQPDATSVFDITPTAQVQVISYLAGQDPATLVLDVQQSAHNTAGTIGYDIGLTSSGVTVSGTVNANVVSYAVGQDPATLVLGATAATWNTPGTIGAAINASASTAPTASQIATAVWQDTTAGDFTVSGSIGKSLFTGGVVPGGTGGLFIAGTNAATTVTTSFTTTFTGNLTGTIGGFTAPALAQFFTTDTTKVYGDAVSGSVVKEIAVGGGSDPWATPVPGSYLAGTAGYILGNRLDVSVSSRSTYAGTDTPGTTTLLSRISGPITINGGAVAIDWAHVLNPTSTVNLSNTTISPTQIVASVSGNVVGTIGGFTTAALAQFFTTNTTKVYTDAVTGSVVKEISSNSSGGTGGITAADVWSYATRTLTSLGATAPVGWINAASIVDHALDGKGDWSTYAGGDSPGVTTLLSRIGGAITIVSGGVNVNLAQQLSSARTLDTVADTSLTLNDAMHCAISTTAGRAIEDKVALTYQRQTPFTGTVLRTFTIDSSSAPTRRT